MAQRSIIRRFGFLAVLTLLVFTLSLSSYALFDWDDRATGDSPLPIAENRSITTYKNVAVSDTFAGVDPDGDALSFHIVKHPARGQVTQGEKGSARFTYTPYEDKTGRDSFTYVAEDGDGHVSQPAVVSVKISRAKTNVTYGDMEGHPAQKAAIALAEKKIFVGEQLGETWFFRPDAEVSREEFLAMAMKMVNLDTLPEAQYTGFSDEESISVWARPYVASALRSGMVQGEGTETGVTCFAPDRAITRTEASVLLSRLLNLSDTADRGNLAEDAAPAWAYQSVVNLEAVGVLRPEQPMNGTLTRAEAAELLLSAQKVLDFREGIW